jgi:hypothetical protein
VKNYREQVVEPITQCIVIMGKVSGCDICESVFYLCVVMYLTIVAVCRGIFMQDISNLYVEGGYEEKEL